MHWQRPVVIWGAFRSWQKMYDKLKKKKSEQEDRYRRCREQTKRVQEDAQLMEHMLTTAQSVDGKEFGRLFKRSSSDAEQF